MVKKHCSANLRKPPQHVYADFIRALPDFRCAGDQVPLNEVLKVEVHKRQFSTDTSC